MTLPSDAAIVAALHAPIAERFRDDVIGMLRAAYAIDYGVDSPTGFTEADLRHALTRMGYNLDAADMFVANFRKAGFALAAGVGADELRALAGLAQEAYSMPLDTQPGAWQDLTFRFADAVCGGAAPPSHDSSHDGAGFVRESYDSAHVVQGSGPSRDQQLGAAGTPEAPPKVPRQLPRPSLEEMVAWLQEGRAAHEAWAQHLRAGRPLPPTKAAIGSAEFHEEWTRRYDELILHLIRPGFATGARP